ncbi:MAG: hypothetical protein AAEJ52_12735 [Myxococcota bacterium]
MKRNQSLIGMAGSIAVALVLSASSAAAGSALDAAGDGIEINRDSAELRDELRPRDVDRDIADTALVFTNLGGNHVRVRCVAFDGNGRAIGRAWLRVPALGVRYLLASDLADGVDFIGHAQCATLSVVKGTAVLLGADVTDLPSMQPDSLYGRIRFPLVATY